MGCRKLTYWSNAEILENRDSDYFTPKLMVLKGGACKEIDMQLWHYQWDLIHDPQNILFAWGQDESEAEYSDQLSGLTKQVEDMAQGLTSEFGNVYAIIHTFEVEEVRENIQVPLQSVNTTDGRQPIFLQGIYNETQNKVKTFTNVLFFQFSQGDLEKFQIDQGAFDFQKDLSERFKISITDKAPYLAVVAPEPFKDYRDCTPFAGDINIIARNAILDNQYEAYYTELLTAIGNCSDTRGILLFVNGYRKLVGVNWENMTLENTDTDNEITTNDRYSYWEGIDQQFIDILKPKPNQIWYADGHHSVTTANHGSLDGFLVSYGSCNETAKNVLIAINPVVGAIIKTTSSCTLNTIPNPDGFNKRKEHGMVAGAQLLEKLKQNVRIDAEGNIIDTIDIVCHSMGFAYAIGMIEMLKQKIPFGRFYIIAPENAEGGSVNLSNWQKDGVWQYGSDESKGPHDQDGIAPQVPVGGIGARRVFIPDNVPQGFLNSHMIVNYGWIFTIQPQRPGYVTPRN